MLMRFDPFREADQLLRLAWPGGRLVSMPLDAYRRGDEFIAELDLPGVDPASIDVTVERGVLEVSAERAARYTDDDEVLAAERPHGRVTRQLLLGDGVDTEHIRASYDDGVLTVALPMAQQAKPHKISVTAGGSRQEAIGAGTAA